MTDGTEGIPEQLSEIPANDAALLRKVYGDQLNQVYEDDKDLPDDEPQEGPCCEGEGE